MRILDNLFGPHANNLSAAMGRTTQRHGLLSNNLANVNTPGYKRKDIDFAIALEHANEPKETTQTGSNRTDGNSIDLEQEVTKIAETELRYQALTDMTNRYFSGLKSVIRESK